MQRSNAVVTRFRLTMDRDQTASGAADSGRSSASGGQHLPPRQPLARRSLTDRAAAAEILIGPNQERE
jgi:hypothetical protein